MVARAGENGRRYTLLNRQLKVRERESQAQTYRIAMARSRSRPAARPQAFVRFLQYSPRAAPRASSTGTVWLNLSATGEVT